MKQCPICQALAFDDAATCYGCLYEFSNEEGATTPSVVPHAVATAPFGAPPAFVIQIKPEREHSGQTSWTCTVDLVPA